MCGGSMTIGSIRRILFLKGSWKWNALVRDFTAKIERIINRS